MPLDLFAEDPFHPALRTHPLTGPLHGTEKGIDKFPAASYIFIGMKVVFDIAAARRNLDRATEERALALSCRYEKANADFNKIAAMVVERYQPERVWQWGTLLEKTSFTEYSDIESAMAAAQ